MGVQNKSGVQYQMNGNMFTGVGGGAVYHLYDFKIDGNLNTTAKKQRNHIAFCKPGALAIDSSRTYYYDKDDSKWKYRYDVAGVCTKGSVAPDCEIPNNTAFMTFFNTSDGASFTFAGEVQKGVEGKINIGAPSGMNFFMAVNPSCREVSLKDIKILGNLNTTAKKQRNYIAFMKPGALAFDSAKTYYYDNADGNWKFRYDVAGVCTKAAVVPDTDKIVIAAGEAVLCSFNSTDGAQISFPSAL